MHLHAQSGIGGEGGYFFSVSIRFQCIAYDAKLNSTTLQYIALYYAAICYNIEYYTEHDMPFLCNILICTSK